MGRSQSPTTFPPPGTGADCARQRSAAGSSAPEQGRVVAGFARRCTTREPGDASQDVRTWRGNRSRSVSDLVPQLSTSNLQPPPRHPATPLPRWPLTGKPGLSKGPGELRLRRLRRGCLRRLPLLPLRLLLGRGLWLEGVPETACGAPRRGGRPAYERERRGGGGKRTN